LSDSIWVYEVAGIEPSARTHGISDPRIRYVVAHWVAIIDEPALGPDDDDVMVFLGHDRTGNALEVGAVIEVADGERPQVRVMHAMKMRAKYRAAYRSVLDR
jgi:hypothetical protein